MLESVEYSHPVHQPAPHRRNICSTEALVHIQYAHVVLLAGAEKLIFLPLNQSKCTEDSQSAVQAVEDRPEEQRYGE